MPGAIQCSFDGAGQPTIRSPKWSGNTGFNYKSSLGGSGSLELSANYFYTATFNWDPSGQYKEPPYGLLSSSLTWTSPGSKYDVQLWCSNCTNKYHDLYIAESSPAIQAAPEAPRYYGVNFGTHF